MNGIARFWGFGVSVAGTWFQLAVIAATVPDFPHITRCLHCDDFDPVHLPGWMPFIENLGTGDWITEISRCPGRQDPEMPFRLDHAPLPPAFRPFDYEDTVLACVRVDAAGSVRSVKLITGTGKGGLDRQLLRTIGRQWRFAPRDSVETRPGWQRIRLSNRPVEPVEISSP